MMLPVDFIAAHTIARSVWPQCLQTANASPLTQPAVQSGRCTSQRICRLPPSSMRAPSLANKLPFHGQWTIRYTCLGVGSFQLNAGTVMACLRSHAEHFFVAENNFRKIRVFESTSEWRHGMRGLVQLCTASASHGQQSAPRMRPGEQRFLRCPN